MASGPRTHRLRTQPCRRPRLSRSGTGQVKAQAIRADCVRMRAFLVMLIGLFCAPAAAQQRIVTFVLDDGLRIEGPVIEFDAKKIVVEVGGEPRAYPTERMRECRFRVVQESEAPAEAPAPIVESKRPVATRNSKSRVVAPNPVGRTTPWRQRTFELQERYPWLVPTEPYQWVSLGVTLFALLALFSHFAAKLSGADQPGFGRAMGLAFTLLLAMFLDFALVGRRESAYGIALALFVLLVPLLHRSCYRMSFPGALLASCLFTAQVGFGYAAFRLVDTMLHSMGVAS